MSTKRIDVYEDMDEIDDTMTEGERALDILADNAVNSEDGGISYFTVSYDGKASRQARNIIEEFIERIDLRQNIYSITRDTIKYGDNFQQVVVGDDNRIYRLIYMPPDSMRRNEDEYGQLMTGEERGKWAFEQYDPGTTNLIAGFLPWQIIHIRWNRPEKSKYGRPLLMAARPAWKKLIAMEESLVINWLTRAFTRLLFKLDVTGKTEKEAQLYIKTFMKELTTRSLTAKTKGFLHMVVAKDIAIGQQRNSFGGRWEESLNDVKVLDTTNTGFTNITAIEYFRDKFVSGTGVPRAHLGLEKDINAKATLEWQDRRFSRTVRRIQSLMSEFIIYLIRMELALRGLDWRKVKPNIRWENPATTDEFTDSQTFLNNTMAAQTMDALGIFDPQWFLKKRLKLSPEEIENYKPRASPKQPEPVSRPPAQAAPPDEEEPEEEPARGNKRKRGK
jgi:hypothetical protein